MDFFADVLQKLESSYEIRSISTTTFLESSTNKMVVAGAFFVAVSCIICKYHVCKKLWIPQYWDFHVLQ